jgi:hypothetical protein
MIFAHGGWKTGIGLKIIQLNVPMTKNCNRQQDEIQSVKHNIIHTHSTSIVGILWTLCDL